MAIKRTFDTDGKCVRTEFSGKDAEKLNRMLRPSQKCLDDIRRVEVAQARAAARAGPMFVD